MSVLSLWSLCRLLCPNWQQCEMVRTLGVIFRTAKINDGGKAAAVAAASVPGGLSSPTLHVLRTATTAMLRQKRKRKNISREVEH